jgi:hypothetical protein
MTFELLGQAVDRPGPGRAVLTRVDLQRPGVELILEVELVGEHAPGLEVGLRVALPALDDALGLRVTLAAEGQPTRSWPQNAANARVGRPS